LRLIISSSLAGDGLGNNKMPVCQTHHDQQSPRIAGCKFHNEHKGSSPPGAVHGVTERWVVVVSSWQNEDKRKQRTLLKERVLPQDHLSIYY
jgi:hypothetical protein